MQVREARKLKKTKANAKVVILDVMKRSSIDFSVCHAMHKLYQYGFGDFNGSQVRKCMDELCDSFELVFNGYKPIKVNDRTVCFDPVFGLPASTLNKGQ